MENIESASPQSLTPASGSITPEAQPVFNVFSGGISQLYQQLRLHEENAVEQNQQIQRLRDTLAAQEGQMKHLRHLLDVLSTSAGTANQDSSTVPPATTFVPDPAIFTGDPEELETWLFHMSNKLSISRNIFYTEEMRIAYAVSRLGGDAILQVRPYMTTPPDGVGFVSSIPSYPALVEILQGAFGDSDPQRTAQERISCLRQENRRVSHYAAEFLRYSGATGYNDPPLKRLWFEGLNPETQTALMYHSDGDSGSLRDVMQRCTAIDARLRTLHCYVAPSGLHNIQHHA